MKKYNIYIPLISLLLLSLSFSNKNIWAKGYNKSVIYVNNKSTGKNDGTTWANAFTDLQDALDAVTDSAEIWIAQGTYYPTKQYDVYNGYATGDENREVTFKIPANTKIYGGFSSSENSIDERDISNNPTILSGDIGAISDTSDNAYHVVVIDQNNIQIDGIIVSNGNANDNYTPNACGGGIYIQDSESSTPSPTITNCIVENNYAEMAGGICFSYSHNTDTSKIINSIIRNNSGKRGAGIEYNNRVAGSEFKLINCLISGNNSIQSAGAFSNICYENTKITVINCTIVGNYAKWQGSVFLNWMIKGDFDINITNSIIWGNSEYEPFFYYNSEGESFTKVTFNYSDVQNSLDNGEWDTTIGYDGGNNISQYPYFILAKSYSDAPTSEGNYHLSTNSPCLNIGDNNAIQQVTDLDNNIRIQQETVDLGAYEGFSSDTKNIEITSPNGGETWYIYSPSNITWTSTNVDSVKIEYTTDNETTWQVICDVTESDGSYSWTPFIEPAKNCKLRIKDKENSSIYDISEDYFSIEDQELLTITSPEEGIKWKVGSTQTILWESDTIDNVIIDYSYKVNNTKTYVSIASQTENDGSYEWTVPNTPSDSCIIHIAAYPSGEVLDETDYFSIINFSFTDISASIAPLRSGSCQWGDFDNDKLMDFLITGRRDSDNLYFTGIYRNTGNDQFDLYTDELPGVAYGKTSWGDYDNDGDLDILLSGYNGTFNDDIVKIYRNDDGNFVSTDFEFDDRLNKAIWGDIDNDGDLDIFANSGSEAVYIYYKNLGDDEFEAVEIDIAKKLQGGDLQFVDFDNNGYLDLFITGKLDDDVLSLLYTNDGNGSFSAIDPSIINVWNHSHPASFGDLDSDGDQDLVIGGRISVSDANAFKTKIYSNDNGSFSEVSYTLPDFSGFSSTLGDLDNDGDLDLLCGGYNSTTDNLRLFRNDGDFNFTEINNDFVNAADGCYDLADYDNDGDLDILVCGTDGSESGFFASIYRNDIDTGNNNPEQPQTPVSNVTDSSIVLGWAKVQDTESKPSSISYNVYVGTKSLGNQIITSHSNNETGKRLIVSIGNAGQLNKKELKNLSPGKYYWAVQAIDNNYQGSEFSEEKTFVVEDPTYIEITSPNGGEAYEVGDETTISWNSEAVEKVNLSFSSNNGNGWQQLETNIENSGKYQWTIPNIISEKCRIMVSNSTSSTAATIIKDVSDTTFKIQDSSLPEVSVENHEDVLSLNGEKKIQVHAADAAGIEKVAINYRKGSDDSYTSSSMTTEDNQNFYFTITSTLLTKEGMEYYITATDSNGNSNKTDIQKISLYCSDGIEDLTVFHSGNQASDYRFFSVPLDRDDNSVANFFTQNPDLGEYDKKKIRLYAFQTESQTWAEYPEFTKIKIATGYAMLTNIDDIRLNSGEGTTVPISNDINISLYSGWNIVGSPFNHDISIEKLDYSDGNFEVWHFSDSWQETTKLEPWIGYAVYVESGGTLTFNSSYQATLDKSASIQNSKDQFLWKSTIELKEDKKILGEYNFGQHENAKTELDEFDRHLPPLLPGQVSLKFLSQDEELSKDYHPVNDDFDQWIFSIEHSGDQEEISLDFMDLPEINSEWDIFLIDQDVNFAYNLQDETAIDIRLRNSSMNFMLVMGEKDILKETISDISLYPEEFILSSNFPNPFNPTTQINYSLPENSPVKIEIFNLKGEKVETLVNDYKSFGNYSVLWDAGKYSSGAYLIKMQAGSFMKVRKCMLIK